MPFATPLPSGILFSGVKIIGCTGGTTGAGALTTSAGALATKGGALATSGGALATSGGALATSALATGASGGALVSGAFEAAALTLGPVESFLAFGFALACQTVKGK